MTKKILLGLGATTALVGTSFAIVSCADDSTPEKTKATIEYIKDAFVASRDEGMSIENYVSKYTDENISADDQKKLDAIFTSTPDGAINSITVAQDGANVKFTLTANENYTLTQDSFDIVYDTGEDSSTPEKTKATIEYIKGAFVASRDEGMSIENYVSKYTDENISADDQKKLDAIFTSTPDGAINSITVAQDGANVKFTLTANENYTLTQDSFDIVYDTGEDSSTPEKTKATIEYIKDAFVASRDEGMSLENYVSKYTDENISADDQKKLDAIFTSTPDGAINSITVAPDGANVKFTLTANENYTLTQDSFDIVYDTGEDSSILIETN